MINLYELGQRYQAGEPDYYIKQYVNNSSAKKSITTENDDNLENKLSSVKKVETDGSNLENLSTNNTQFTVYEDERNENN